MQISLWDHYSYYHNLHCLPFPPDFSVYVVVDLTLNVSSFPFLSLWLNFLKLKQKKMTF